MGPTGHCHSQRWSVPGLARQQNQTITLRRYFPSIQKGFTKNGAVWPFAKRTEATLTETFGGAVRGSGTAHSGCGAPPGAAAPLPCPRRSGLGGFRDPPPSPRKKKRRAEGGRERGAPVGAAGRGAGSRIPIVTGMARRGPSWLLRGLNCIQTALGKSSPFSRRMDRLIGWERRRDKGLQQISA